MSWDQELEDFKTRIDLRAFAAQSFGFEFDRRDSSRNSTVMRHGREKIVIKLDEDGHYVFCNVHDDGDRGSIIDLVQRRKQLTLGEVRKELRPWLGRAATPLPFFPRLERTARDRLRVEEEFSRMQDITRHEYLESERRLPPGLLALPRFAGRIRSDGRDNAVFPHYDEEGLCGYELKNSGFTGFAKGGEKGLWFSRTFAGDRSLVFAEGAIDALSFAALFRDAQARYASIGGQVSPRQPDLLRRAIGRMPESARIIAAMDADEDGRKLAALVMTVFGRAARPDLTFEDRIPVIGKDWNDTLRQSAPPVPFPTALSRF